MVDRRILMGNEVIGRALVEQGCTLAASYPGTPASEILEAVAAAARETGTAVHAEWSVNEKVAFETALAHAMTGKRAAVSMKQVGLNVASDPLMRSAYLGTVGGFVVVSADDPGPHSSQTDQDSRFFAMFARVPVLDPSGPREAGEMVGTCYELSERHGLPVMLRPTTRVCHGRQPVECRPPAVPDRKASFARDPARWCATPGAMKELHRGLNRKLESISREEALAPRLTPGDGTRPGRCVIASGVAYATCRDIMEELGLLGKVDLFQVVMPFPLAPDFIANIKKCYEHIVVIEETYPVVEMQLLRADVRGRRSGHVPDEGELTPEVVRGVLQEFAGLPRTEVAEAPRGGVRPTLCAGCGHRAAFYGMKRALRKGLFPGDIGCYTLGVNLGAVDACHCMGAGISQAAGFYRSWAQDGGDVPPIAATIGDSTFFHSGIPALINAVAQGARIIVVILDNGTTAMTGHQPTPQQGRGADGGPVTPVAIPDLVRACGVRFLREHDPYDLPGFMAVLKEADAFRAGPDGGVAVVIAGHPCVLDKRAPRGKTAPPPRVTPDCTGCRHCVDAFECPALAMDETTGTARVIDERCTGCGVCIHVCPVKAIVPAPLAGGEGSGRGETRGSVPPRPASARDEGQGPARDEGAAEAHAHGVLPVPGVGTRQRIVISGLGGQGALTITRLLAEAALARGVEVITAETHGMAQRGGTVVSSVKVGPFRGPMVGPGEADLILFLHAGNLPVHRHLLAPGGVSVTATTAGGDPNGVNAAELAAGAGAPRGANLVLAGFAAGRGLLFCGPGLLEEAVRRISPPKRLESDLAALRAGIAAGMGR